MWTEINEKAALRARAAAHPSLPSTDTPTSKHNKDEGESVEVGVEGTLFDELILQYSKLSARADDMMIKQVCHEVEGELKPYLSTYVCFLI